MKVTQNTIKNARSGNTFWRVMVDIDHKGELCTHTTRIDLKGKRIRVNFDFCGTSSVKIESDRMFSGNFLNDVAGHGHRVHTFTQEKQAKKFADEILTMQHLHPLAVQDAINDYNDRQFFNFYIDQDLDCWN